MSADERSTSSMGELDAINRSLAALLRADAFPLSRGVEACFADDLVLCGVLGGKNVGKSTLINALARRRVSIDADAAVRGTDRPVVYVHARVEDAAAARLRSAAPTGAMEFVTHQIDEVHNLVLVDLPDFDSEFHDHVETVRRVAPLLDRVIWVATPRKLGDRAWLEMLRDVIKDARNVHCVLNKVDELLSDADPFPADANEVGAKSRAAEAGNGSASARFRQQYDVWLAEVATAAGCAHEASRRFLIAAAFENENAFAAGVAQRWNDSEWKLFAGDRRDVFEVGRLAAGDLDRLRRAVLAPLGDDEVRALKQANRARELSVQVDRLRAHYELDRTLETLSELCDPNGGIAALRSAFDDDARSLLAGGVARRMRGDRALADELLERRVESWPLLRLVHWPLGWLARTLGQRVAATSRLPAVEPSDAAVIDDGSLRERIELLRMRLLADAGVVAERLEIARDLPPAEQLARKTSERLAALAEESEVELIDGLVAEDRRPSWIGRMGLWFVWLWFPLVQPLSAGLLEMYVETGTVHWLHGAYRVVTALSAAHLLAGFAVAAGVCVALLAGMYSRALRAVRSRFAEEQRFAALEGAVDRILFESVFTPLIAPFAWRYRRLVELDQRLGSLLTSDSLLSNSV